MELESGIRNPDIMNDDRVNSPQQCLISKYIGKNYFFIFFVWNNRNIFERKKHVLYQYWYDAGINKISDILNQNQDFLEWHELALKFNVNLFFTTYYGLVNAIPKDGKANLKNPTSNAKHHLRSSH